MGPTPTPWPLPWPTPTPSPPWPPLLPRLSSPPSPSTPSPPSTLVSMVATPLYTARGLLMPRLTPLSFTLPELLPSPLPTLPELLPMPWLLPTLTTPSLLWPPSPRPLTTVWPLPMLDSSTLPTLESASTTLVSRSPAKQYNYFHITK